MGGADGLLLLSLKLDIGGADGSGIGMIGSL